MRIKEEAIKVDDEFTRDGLRAYVLSNLDEESYSDESLYGVCERFNYRLHQKAESLSEDMKGFGIKFYWYVNMGKFIYHPKDDLEEYIYFDSSQTEHLGINAILAFLRDEVSIEEVSDDYWSERSPLSAWK